LWVWECRGGRAPCFIRMPKYDDLRERLTDGITHDAAGQVYYAELLATKVIFDRLRAFARECHRTRAAEEEQTVAA
jgi:hypothetical protein